MFFRLDFLGEECRALDRDLNRIREGDGVLCLLRGPVGIVLAIEGDLVIPYPRLSILGKSEYATARIAADGSGILAVAQSGSSGCT